MRESTSCLQAKQNDEKNIQLQMEVANLKAEAFASAAPSTLRDS